MFPNKEELGSDEESDGKKESNDLEASIGAFKIYSCCDEISI